MPITVNKRYSLRIMHDKGFNDAYLDCYCNSQYPPRIEIFSAKSETLGKFCLGRKFDIEISRCSRISVKENIMNNEESREEDRFCMGIH